MITIATSTGISPLGFLIALSIGLGLSAAAGFRAFIPFLLYGLFARGGLVSLSESYEWMGSTWAIYIFGIATALEISGYLIPWFDNLLDSISIPVAILGGMILTSSCLDGIDPAFQWILAIIAGGGVAGVTQLGTVATRAISTATTGGLGNPFFSLFEDILAIAMALLAILLPMLSILIVILLMILIVSNISKIRRKIRNKKLAKKY